MSTSVISLDQIFNANDVDIMVLEHSCFFWSYLPRRSWRGGGGVDDMVQNSPRSKLELHCKAPVSSSTSRTENIPLLNKRLDELIECN